MPNESAANPTGGAKPEILTIPNFITLIRFLGTPVFLWVLFGQNDRVAAAILLGALASTDWLDGFLARRLGQESKLGQIMDPFVDRVIILTGILALIIDKSVPFWFAVVVLFREALVMLGALIVGAKGGSIEVNWLGKSSTMALMFTFPAFLISEGSIPSGAEDAFTLIAWITGIPGVALAYVAAFLYIPKIVAIFKS